MIFKKPKFWDLKKSNLLSKFLLPLTFPILLNNFFLNKKNKKKSLNIKTICVGNIYLGGTGKTPTTIKLYEILKSRGFNVATGKKNYINQEDEKIILEKETALISYKTREEIIRKALDSKKEVLIFDDGLQDKDIDYNLKFVCFDKNNWIGNGYLIPAGPLREKLNSLKKYDAVFLKGDNSLITNIENQIKRYNSQIKIFYSSYKPVNLKDFEFDKKYLIFSGIGNPKSFKDLLIKNNFNIAKEIIFPDHFNYKLNDIKKIEKMAKDLDAKIITTEKDFVKIKKFKIENINFLKVELEIENKENLINFLKLKI